MSAALSMMRAHAAARNTAGTSRPHIMCSVHRHPRGTHGGTHEAPLHTCTRSHAQVDTTLHAPSQRCDLLCPHPAPLDAPWPAAGPGRPVVRALLTWHVVAQVAARQAATKTPPTPDAAAGVPVSVSGLDVPRLEAAWETFCRRRPEPQYQQYHE